MATRAFKLDPRSSVNGATPWSVSSGTAIAALTKTGIPTGSLLGAESAPASNEPRITSVTNGAVLEVKFGSTAVIKEIDELLKAGGEVTVVRICIYGEEKGVTGKSLKTAFGGQSFEGELTKGAAGWIVTLSISEANIAANLATAARIEEAVGTLTKVSAKELWLWEAMLEVAVKEGAAAKKVAGQTSTGAVVSAASQRLAQPSAAGASGVTSHVRLSAVLARLAKSSAGVSGGASVSVGAIVKTERGAIAVAVTSGARVAAVLARQARASAAMSTGASVSAQTSRIAPRAAAVSSGASVRATAQRISQPLTRVAGGAVVTATIRRVAKVTAAITAGPSTAAATHARIPIRASVSGGASVYATVTRVGQSEEPPSATPVAGHVAIGQRGTIGVHRGRIATGNVGRAER